MVAVNAPVPRVPLLAFVPVHPPDAVHPVALVELHDSVDVAPLGIADGVAVKSAVGMMLTVVLETALVPPVPVQISEYTADVESAPVLWVPPVALVPVQAPDAVQEVALVELHVSVEVPPPATLMGFAVKVAVG